MHVLCWLKTGKLKKITCSKWSLNLAELVCCISDLLLGNTVELICCQVFSVILSGGQHTLWCLGEKTNVCNLRIWFSYSVNEQQNNNLCRASSYTKMKVWKNANVIVSAVILKRKYVNFTILENSLRIVFDYWLMYEFSSDHKVVCL